MRKILYLIVGFVGSWIGIEFPALSAEDITILHTSEHHGTALPLERSERNLVGGFARRATIVAKVEGEGNPVLLVDTGDLLIGTPMSSWFRGEPDVLAMNLLRYDAVAAGNHDFDYGLDHLDGLNRLANFPILCTNLRARSGVLPCQPSLVTRLGRLSVGVLGVVGYSNFPETFNRQVVEEMELIDPLEAIHHEVKRLQSTYDVDVIVLLTHQSTEEDLRLLQVLHGVDVMIGGHTEGFGGMYIPGRSKPSFVQIRPRSLYVKTHRQGRTVGRLNIRIEDGEILRAEAMNIPVSAETLKDQTVSQLLSDYRQRFSEEARQILGHASVGLQGERPRVRTQETNFGNLLADLMRKRFGVDVALINGGQIRGSIKAGPVTFGDVLSVLPFDSPLVTLDLPGRILWQVLEHSVSRWPNHDGRFLQVSGLRATFHMKNPVGSRLKHIFVGEHTLEEDKWYSIVTDVFVANGGDGYTMFSQAKNRVERQLPLRDLFHAALLRGPVHATLERRLVLSMNPMSP